MSLKWTDQQFAPRGQGPPRTSVAKMIAELETQPGRWAEIARYPAASIQTARVRGATNKRRHHPQLQYTVELEGDEAVLYYRVAPPE